MKPTSRGVSPAATTVAARSVVLGTAGHIDHGKTALVLALTGTDTDRLPEEKSRGITIDLGFAALRLEDAQGRAVDLELIDVPGHHAFLRNMLAGAGGIDCVLLVVAADEGVRAQTVEHLAICGLLGIRRGVIALTKADAVNAERLAEARGEVQRLAEHTFLEGAAVVAVSAFTREGIPELKAALARMVSEIPERSADLVPRLPLDRAFTVRGFGTVVTGTLQSGTMRAGETLELQPERRAVRVRGVQVHGAARGEAQAPVRLALNLAGVEVAEVKRGDTLVPPGTLEPVRTIDAEVTMLPGVPALRHRARVRVHALTAEALATVLRFDEGPDGGTVLVRLRLAKPMVVAPGDRFVIRRASPAMTLAGGRVLDAHPVPRVKKAVALRWLEQIREAAPGQQVLLRVERRGLAGTTVAALVRETGLTAKAVRGLVKPLLGQTQLVGVTAEGAAPEHLIVAAALGEAAESLLRELRRSKEAVARAELRSRTRLAEWVFELAVGRLQRDKQLEATAAGLGLPGQGAAAVPAGQSRRLAELEGIYTAAGLASPILSEVGARLGIATKELPGLVTALLRAKKLVRMGADNLFIHADALARLTADLQQHRGESFDVGRFKSFTSLTRKHAIPLLEYLDGARVTRNSNGVRVVL